MLARVYVELLNRSLRLKNYVRDVGPGESNEYVDLAPTVTGVLDEFTRVAAEALEQSRRVRPKLSDEERKLIFRVFAAYSRAFTTAHQFLAYLPTLGIRPETLRVLEGTFGSLFKKYRPSVLLTAAFNAVEFDFVEQLYDSLPPLSTIRLPRNRNIVLQLPTCDAACPTAWSILAHELGHAIDADERISAQAAKAIVRRDDTPEYLLVRDMCEEITADLIGARAMGAAPVLALMSMSYCLLPQEPVLWNPESRLRGRPRRVYPATRWRVRVVKDYLSGRGKERALLESEAAGYENAWQLKAEIELGVNVAARLLGAEERIYRELIEPMSTDIARRVDSLNLDQVAEASTSLDRFERRLGVGLPVAAQGESRATLRSAVERYLRMPKRTERDFRELVARFREVPATVRSILTSGFLHRNGVIGRFVDVRRSKNASTDICATLDRTDSLLRASVETSSVHRRLLLVEQPADSSSKSAAIPRAVVRRAGNEKSLLSDIQILSRLVARDSLGVFVSPVTNPDAQLGPSSLDVRLGTDVYVTTTTSATHIDLGGTQAQLERQKLRYFRKQRLGTGGEFVLHPGEFALASTLEYFKFPRDIAGRLEGRSSLGRLGLQVHATAGFVDPGFEGNLTFELINSGKLPIRIEPGFRLGQICFFPVECVQVPYDAKPHAKYAGSISVELSLIEMDPEVAKEAKHD